MLTVGSERMKVFIVGGTGFIGYYSTLEFLKRGHSVSTISLPDIKLGSWFPKEANVEYGDIFKMPKADLVSLFSGFDAMVYAVGPDDRVTPKAPAYDFFYERLVTACINVVSAAKEAGVKKCVVLNSYFAYFDRVFPKYNLAKRHPYIKCRVEQASLAIQEGSDKIAVMILELPYIFGTMPERVPIWKDLLIKRLQKQKVIFYPKGGSNMISIEHVAESVAGAIENGRHGQRYPIGDVNFTWKQLLQVMLDSMDMGNKKIITIPCFLASLYGRILKNKEKRLGLEAGLALNHLFKDIMCREFYFDPSRSAGELGYGRGGIEEAINKTIKVCLEK